MRMLWFCLRGCEWRKDFVMLFLFDFGLEDKWGGSWYFKFGDRWGFSVDGYLKS